MDIVFVILHYKTYRDTDECVQSLKEKIDSTLYHIIIVDNYSNNDSLEKLKSKYKNDKNVTILENNKNLGFARGLNKGIRFAREKFRPKYIAAINNDTLLVSEDMVYKLDKKMDEYSFSLCGPMIITRDGKCSINPIRNSIRSKNEVSFTSKQVQSGGNKCEIYFLGKE